MAEIKKGQTYVCIEDWHKLGTSFTKGKIYKCHKDGCMHDDFGAEKASVEKLFKPLKECKQEVEVVTSNGLADIIIKAKNESEGASSKWTLANVLASRSECEDEEGSGGLWDFAAELAVLAGLEMKDNGLIADDTPIYADECGQESIYNALVEFLGL